MQDFQQQSKTTNKTYLCYQNSLSDDYELVDDEDEDDEEDEQTPNDQSRPTDVWSDIPLNSGTMTASNSTTSSYSQRSDHEETIKNDEILNPNESNKEDDKKSSGFSDWISKSSFRRQSLEDVFAQSTLFGKFGRSNERRNSESEVENATSSSSMKKEFFLFGRTDGLSDSQVESLFLTDEHL